MSVKRITPINNNGTLQLKFQVNNKRYSFAPIPKAKYTDRVAYTKVLVIAERIMQDIESDCFDTSLLKYKVYIEPIEVSKPIVYLRDLWDRWIEAESITVRGHYKYTQIMIYKHNPKIQDVKWLTECTLASATYKDRLSLVKKCSAWGFEYKLIGIDPYRKLKPRRKNSKPIRPFTKSEVQTILDVCKSDFPDYYLLILFCFYSGCRISEAIAIKYQTIDAGCQVTIDRSLSIDYDNSTTERILKTTKTDKVRILRLPKFVIEEILAARPADALDTDYIFIKRDCNFHLSNFRNRCWKPLLERAGIPYRKFHTTRHTLISQLLTDDFPVMAVKYIAGHSTIRSTTDTYGHYMSIPFIPNPYCNESTVSDLGSSR